jgi:cobalt-zinc-cadmium efflux system outer membrane protein
MMKSIIHILLLASVSICSQGQTLEAYLKQAAENNPDIKAGYNEFNAALQKIPQVNTLPDPTVSFGVFVSPIETRVGAQRAKVSLSQMFPWFGTLPAREDAASLMAQAKFKEIAVAKNELFLNVKQAYFPIYEIREHIRINNENLNILDTYKQLSTIKYANGKVPLTDILRVDIMVENLKTDIKILNESLHPFYISFNRLLNRNDTLIVIIENPLLLQIKEDSKDETEGFIKTNPSLQLIDTKIEAELANEKLAKLKSKPNFGVGLDYAMISKRKGIEMAQNGKDALMPMVTLSLPIFKKKNEAFVKESQLIQLALSEKKQGMENKLWSIYATASFEVDKAKELYQHYQNQIDKNNQIMNLLYTAYANSGRDFEEVLRVQQETLKYEMAKATATKNYHLGLAKVDFITAKKLF